jgi:hypothetical protein
MHLNLKESIMSLQQTNIIKGIAILLMLWLHLFMYGSVEYSHPLLYVGNTPLVNILTRACGPVPFFMILSGYGLSYTRNHKFLNFKTQFIRILKLYINYWWVLIFFVGIGCVISPNKYPGSFINVVSNLTGWNTTYDSPMWFLFPYMLISLSSMLIFKIMDKIGNISSFVIFGLLSLVSMYMFHKYSNGLLSECKILNQFFAYFDLLFSFVIGAIMNRISERRSISCKYLTINWHLSVFLILLLFLIKCLFRISVFDSIYALLFIMLFINIPIDNLAGKVLTFLGKYSMPIWMIHAFLALSLFRDVIYGFKYPIIIFLILILLSVMCSIPILRLSKYCINKLNIK